MNSNTFVKQLSSNARTTRENAIKTLNTYIHTAQFTKAAQAQHNKLWKGLYYAMWFSDRPRPQQRLAQELADLFNELDPKAFIKFSKAFWTVMIHEWYELDHHRLDKFLMLVRRVISSQMLYVTKHTQISGKWIQLLSEGVLSGDAKVSFGLPGHFIDVLCDEWEKFEDVEDVSVLKDVVEIFQGLKADTNNSKILRSKIQEDLLDDQRLKQWGVIEEEQVSGAEAENNDSDSEAEEWNGF